MRFNNRFYKSLSLSSFSFLIISEIKLNSNFIELKKEKPQLMAREKKVKNHN